MQGFFVSLKLKITTALQDWVPLSAQALQEEGKSDLAESLILPWRTVLDS
jgi:hypothetical protein